MSDQPPESRPVLPPDPDAQPTQALPAEGAAGHTAEQTAVPPENPPAKQRLRDRLWSFRAVIAVALASVIIGGLGGAALANVSEGGNDGRRGPGGFGRGGPGGPGGPPGMMNRGPHGRNQLPNGGMGQRRWDDRMPRVRPDEPDALPTPPIPTPTR